MACLVLLMLGPALLAAGRHARAALRAIPLPHEGQALVGLGVLALLALLALRLRRSLLERLAADPRLLVSAAALAFYALPVLTTHGAVSLLVRAWSRGSLGDALAGAAKLLPLGSREGAGLKKLPWKVLALASAASAAVGTSSEFETYVQAARVFAQAAEALLLALLADPATLLSLLGVRGAVVGTVVVLAGASGLLLDAIPEDMAKAVLDPVVPDAWVVRLTLAVRGPRIWAGAAAALALTAPPGAAACAGVATGAALGYHFAAPLPLALPTQRLAVLLPGSYELVRTHLAEHARRTEARVARAAAHQTVALSATTAVRRAFPVAAAYLRAWRGG